MITMNMPGFSAEASIYRTGSYREMQVDKENDAFGVVVALKCYEDGCVFGNAWCGCYCPWGGDCHCSCCITEDGGSCPISTP